MNKSYTILNKITFLKRTIQKGLMIYVFVLLGLAQSGLQAQSCTMSVPITGTNTTTNPSFPGNLPLDGTAAPFTLTPNCQPTGPDDVVMNRGFMIGCTPSQASCPTSDTPTPSVIPTAMCPLDEVTYQELTAPNQVFVQYWNDCVGSTLAKDFRASSQGFANQMFCAVDVNGYPEAPLGAGAPLSGLVSNLPTEGEDIPAMVAELGSTADCGNNADTQEAELLQADFWVIVPTYVQSLGIRFAGSRDDQALFMIGPSLSQMCATADFVGNNTGSQGIETLYYNIPPTAPRVCNGILLRARMYVSDLADRFRIDPEFDFGDGNGFGPVGNGLLYPVANAADDIPPVLQYDATVLTGYRDMDDNIYALQADGSFALSDHGCFIAETVNGTLMITSTDTEVCLDSSITIVGSGTPATTDAYVSGTPATATIDPVTGVITTVAPGMTLITYTDALGCTVDVTVTVIDCCTPDCGVFPANPAGN